MTDQEKLPVKRVMRSKRDAQASYDSMSRIYDWLAGSSEWKFVRVGLEQLAAVPGERVLEIGFGTGKSLIELAQAVGPEGSVEGIDISPGMLAVAEEGVANAGLGGRVHLQVGDGAALPYEDRRFDAVFMSFTLELFDTPEIPVVLAECRRVLCPGGRIGVVAMQMTSDRSLMLRLYGWAHDHFERFVDCRPIYLEQDIASAGFEVRDVIRLRMWGLPVSCVLGLAP
ncbi:MAG: class I SAM-dependent methyltransferase [Anaerolineales bacterium]